MAAVTVGSLLSPLAQAAFKGTVFPFGLKQIDESAPSYWQILGTMVTSVAITVLGLYCGWGVWATAALSGGVAGCVYGLSMNNVDEDELFDHIASLTLMNSVISVALTAFGLYCGWGAVLGATAGLFGAARLANAKGATDGECIAAGCAGAVIGALGGWGVQSYLLV